MIDPFVVIDENKIPTNKGGYVPPRAIARVAPIPLQKGNNVRDRIGGIEDYREALSGSADVPLWQQPWWLDITAPGDWNAVCLLKGGRLVAALPYVATRQRGIKVWTQPPLTQALGPWLETMEMKPVKALSRQHALLGELADAIPDHVFYRQNWTPDRSNWLPFHWRGFRQTTRYTYRLDMAQGTAALWDHMSDSTRNAIRKAERRFGVTTETSTDIESLLRLNTAAFSRQGMTTPHPAELVRRIHSAATSRGASTMWIAQEADGTTSAAAYIVRDEATSYYLFGGADPDRRSSGAQNLVLWRAIQDAAERSETFDFEGSMSEAIEGSFRSYGSTQVPYFSLSGSTNKWLRRRMAVQDATARFRR